MKINLSFLEFDISKLNFKGHFHINVQLFGLLLKLTDPHNNTFGVSLFFENNPKEVWQSTSKRGFQQVML